MAKQSLGIIGAGAFGAFMAKHLAPHFALSLYDATPGKAARAAKKLGAKSGDLKQIASCDIVVIAVPVQKIESVLKQISGMLKPGALVLDVASVKLKPILQMKTILPKHVDILGTHPLFGPQTGKHGIKGLNIVLCDVRGSSGKKGRAACVATFLRRKLGLAVHQATPEAHDRELAYVQGLTHMLMKVVVALDLPRFRFTTKTYDYLQQMVEMIRYDSDELFRAIARENPFSGEAKKRFFAAARQLEKNLGRH
jgi:prephenate dehydrogenase